MILKDKDIIEMAKKGELIMMGFNESNVTPNGYDISFDVTMSTPIVPAEFHGAVFISNEYFKMPNDVIGTLWLKSRYCRAGAWGSFGLVDAGFEGNLSVTLFNMPIELPAGVIPLVQIVFEKLDGSVDKAYAERSGHYQQSKSKEKVADPEYKLIDF